MSDHPGDIYGAFAGAVIKRTHRPDHSGEPTEKVDHPGDATEMIRVPPEVLKHPMRVSVKDIVEAFLANEGYDGLCNPDVSCGCGLEDLVPCGEISMDCRAAYRRKLPCGEDCPNCEESTFEPGAICFCIRKE